MSTSCIFSMRPTRVALRSMPPRSQVHGVRFNSNQIGESQKTRVNPISISHIVSGLFGGGVVILGGYLFYHFSGTRPAVDTTVDTHNRGNNNTQAKNLHHPPNAALAYLRSLVKSQVALIPGGSWAVDSLFDSIDELHKTHRKEIDSIVSDAYKDIKRITDERGALDRSTTIAILGVLRTRVGELGGVAGKASSDAISPVLSKYPGLRDTLGGKWAEFRDYAKGHGPETKRIYNEAENQIIDTVDSQGVNVTSVATILQILREKSGEAKRATEDTSWYAWERAQELAAPASAKIPDVKKVLDENTSALIKLGGGVATTSGTHARDVWNRVKGTAESTGSLSGAKLGDFKDFILQKRGKGEKEPEKQREGRGGWW